ncbi:hypothetical protein ACFOY2_13850 [Nonomuraea purpurea]|uniref:Lipoprotein n=1 Tax=Nonomuraea purpurea TaxID=1849276 RepID=A0ABV8G5J7_9ACTN
MKSIQVAVAAAAAAIALTACSSPMQAGAAAVVGNERISSSQLTAETAAYVAALKRANLDESQLGGIPASHFVLQRMTDVSAFKQILTRHNVQVSQTEIDAAIKDPGQAPSAEINLLSRGVLPTDAREFGRVLVGLGKLQQQFGGQNGGQERLIQERAAIKTIYNPRFGMLNPQPTQENPGMFIDSGRFGKSTTQQAPQQG